MEEWNDRAGRFWRCLCRGEKQKAVAENVFVFYAQKTTKKRVKFLLKNGGIKWENHLAFSLGR